MSKSDNRAIQQELLTGPVASGKTEYLIKRVAALLEQGAAPGDISVFCCTPDAAVCTERRMLESLGNKAKEVRVITPREWALSLLSSAEAQAFTGRQPRILLDFEHNFLLEDMKTSGLKPRRLKEMLGFFYRSITEGANHEQGWLISAEEQEVYSLLQSYLVFYGGMLESEVSNLALSYVRSSNDVLKAHAIKHVLVDDYQNLSKSSQELCCLLATDSLCVAGNLDESLEVYESYPYGKGLGEFAENNEHCASTKLLESYLPEAVKNTSINLQSLIAQGAPLDELTGNVFDNSNEKEAACSNKGALEVCVYPGIPDEFEGIAQTISSKLSNNELAPEDIFVVVPNKTWSSHFARILEALGHKTESLPFGQPLKGDIRNVQSSAALRIFTALRLIANPADMVSWRCWCGFGSYLTESASFALLKRDAQTQNSSLLSLLETLNSAESSLVEQHEKVLQNYRAGKKLLKEYAELTGFELLENLAAALDASEGYAIVEELSEELDDADTAACIVNRIEQRLLAPRFESKSDTIKIGPAQSLCGRNPELLIYTGFVSGFVPERDIFDNTKTTLQKQETLFKENAKLLYASMGKARGKLVVSSFEKTDLESAELLKLKIKRIRVEEGAKICTIAPSIFAGALSK